MGRTFTRLVQVAAFVAALALSVGACTTLEEPDPFAGTGVEKTFRASTPATRVLLDGERNALWESGEDISVEGVRFTQTECSGTEARFSGIVPVAKDHYLALLPWSNAWTFGDRSVSGTLPSRQTAHEGGLSYPLAFAWSEGETLRFHHLTSALQITLGSDMDDVREITVRGNAEEILAGDFQLSLDEDGTVASFSGGSTGSRSVTLEGSLEAGKTYVVSVLGLGQTFSSGLTLEVLFSDGTLASVSNPKSVRLDRGHWINLSSGMTRSKLTPVDRGIGSLSDWRAFHAALDASSSIDEWCWGGEVRIRSDIEGLVASDALSALSVPLNGGGHTLSFAGTSALIDTLRADVRNLRLEGAIEFPGNSAIGALASVAKTGITISNVQSDIDITAGAVGMSTGIHLGGLVGTVSGTSGTLSFKGCTVTGDLTALNYIPSLGGIIAHGGSGSAPEVLLEDCCYNGSILYAQGGCPYNFDTDKERAAGRLGGLIGDASRVVTLRNSSTGSDCTITVRLNKMTLGSGGVGGLVGRTTNTSSGYTMSCTFEGTNTNRAAITVYDALLGQHSGSATRFGQTVGRPVKAPSGSGVAAGSLTFIDTPSPSTATSGRFKLCQISARKTGWLRDLNSNLQAVGYNYMSYLIVTENTGKVIVVDGGYPEDAPFLKSKILEFGGHVDAWFISHPHEDHYGAFLSILDNPEGVTIGMVYHSKANTTNEFYTRLAASSVPVTDIRYPWGRYDLDGIGIKVLSVADPALGSVNDCSMVLRIWDDTKSVVLLGDAGVPEGRKLLATCPQDLNCNYLQLGHHGNKGCEQAFYDAVSFDYALVPTAIWIWHPELFYNSTPDNLDGGATRRWIEAKLPPSRIITSYEHQDWWLDNQEGGMGSTLDGFDIDDSDLFN